MLVKFLLDITVSPDGQTLLEAKAGSEHEFEEGFAKHLLKNKIVQLVEAAVVEPVLETKVIETKAKGRK